MSAIADSDLENCILQAISWIRSNQGEFSASNAVDHEERLQLLKPLGELALTMDVINRLHPGKFEIQDIIPWCWDELERGNTLVETLVVRPDLIVSATLYVCFRRIGLQNQKLDRLIRFLMDSPSARHVELPTWRRLDVEHGFESLGLSVFPEFAEKQTWFGALPEPWTLTDDIAYSMTHNVFYITDFGFRPERISLEPRNYILTWLPSWLFIYARQENWDVFSELLMVSGCLNSTEHFSGYFSQLLAAQESNGMTKGPKNSAKNLLKEEQTLQRTAFLKNYHTTLVSLMACAFGMKGYAALSA